MSAAPVQLSAATSVVGRRVGAFLIDSLITAAAYFALFFLLAERQAVEPAGGINATLTVSDTVYAITGGQAALFFLICLAGWLAYWAVLPGVRGFTLGKLTAGIRVVGADGRLPAGIGRNVLRQLMWIVDDFPYLVPGLVGFITALATPGHRRVGDMAAGTYVVRKDAAGRPLQPVAGAPESAAGLGAPALGGLVGPTGPANRTSPASAPPGPAVEPSPAPPPPPPPPTTAPAGWYDDPHGEARLRYWDGRQWTGHTAP